MRSSYTAQTANHPPSSPYPLRPFETKPFRITEAYGLRKYSLMIAVFLFRARVGVEASHDSRLNRAQGASQTQGGGFWGARKPRHKLQRDHDFDYADLLGWRSMTERHIDTPSNFSPVPGASPPSRLPRETASHVCTRDATIAPASVPHGARLRSASWQTTASSLYNASRRGRRTRLRRQRYACP